MPNITVTVDDEVYRSARVHAAEAGTSVSALVRDYLTSLTEPDAEFARLEQLQTETITRARTTGSFSAANRLSRDDVHDRAALR